MTFGPGGGGAIAKDGPELLYATADGRFFRVNPETLTVSENVLPPLELGRGKYWDASKRIVYRELDPRVHDIAASTGNTSSLTTVTTPPSTESVRTRAFRRRHRGVEGSIRVPPARCRILRPR